MQNVNEARAAILTSIRQNLAKSSPYNALRSEHDALQLNAKSLVHEKSFTENVPVVYSPKNSLLVDFQENLEAVGAKCSIVSNKEEATEEIKRIIADLNPQRIALSDSPLVNEIKDSLKTNAKILQKAAAQDLFSCDLGVTSAQWAIAETGTLVLESKKEFSRLTSLVPPVHICLLEAQNIHQTMTEILQILNAGGRESLSRAITFITGPSRTSDIELTLAIGVHGPARLHVIVIK